MKSHLLYKFLKLLLKNLAILTRKKYKPTIIGITGSVGKTSTKEAIYTVLKNERKTRRSQGNFNNEIGLPLTILGDYQEIKGIFFWPRVFLKSLWQLVFTNKNYPEVLVLEMAADRPGDIAYLSKIAQPQIGVITAIGEIPVHVEFYPSSEAVAREKAKLIEELPPRGFAVLNCDDPIVWSLKHRTRAHLVSYGFSDEAQIQVVNWEWKIENEKIEGMSFKISYGGTLTPFRLKKAFGKPQIYAVTAAIAVGLIFGINLVKISEAIENYEPLAGRMKLLKGVKNSLILDDSYNASPLSMRAALETLKSLPAKRKVAVLGDMLEIGKYSTEAHQAIGELAGKVVDVLFCIGPRSKFIAEKAIAVGLSANYVKTFEDAEKAKKIIEREIKSGDLILIKGSHAMALEKIVEEIKAEDS